MMQELVVLLLTGNYYAAIILVVILAQLACRDKGGGINNQEDVRKALFLLVKLPVGKAISNSNLHYCSSCSFK